MDGELWIIGLLIIVGTMLILINEKLSYANKLSHQRNKLLNEEIEILEVHTHILRDLPADIASARPEFQEIRDEE